MDQTMRQDPRLNIGTTTHHVVRNAGSISQLSIFVDGCSKGSPPLLSETSRHVKNK